jgi:hypothetical protein
MINIANTSSQRGFPAIPGTRLCFYMKSVKQFIFTTHTCIGEL